MTALLAALPLLVVLGLMLLLRWGAQRAGPAGWLAGLLVGATAFGLTPQVFWVSQAKGLLFSLYVLTLLWSALFLYNVVDRAGGVRAIASALESAIADRGALWVVLAWAFSGMLEGMAGFGLPVAIGAPMLAGAGVEPVRAVAAVAVGHAWSVTFGDMGIIWQTLIAVLGMDGAALAPTAALLLGFACLLCGLAAASILGQSHRFAYVVALAAIMAGTQYLLVRAGLPALAGLGAGLAGMAAGVWLNRARPGGRAKGTGRRRALVAALCAYGGLIALMVLVTAIDPVREVIGRVMWQPRFPAVQTLAGFTTPAGPGQAFRVFTYPGTAILLVACVSAWAFARAGLLAPGQWRAAAILTRRMAVPSSIGTVFMVGLALLMDHCGMTMRLAHAAVGLFGGAFPLASPLVGMLGAFATGSNNNSNVLFATLQRDAAALLGMVPAVVIAAQTTGGSLGSMVAPAKLLVGCSTTGLAGREGDVLRITLPYGLVIGALVGLAALLLSWR